MVTRIIPRFVKVAVRRTAWQLAKVRNTRLWPFLIPIVRALRKPARLDLILGMGRDKANRFLFQNTVSEPFTGEAEPRSVRRKLQLGFYDAALRELETIANQPGTPERRESAMWELALWHVNQPGETAARIALRHLDVIEKLSRRKIPASYRAVLRTECLLRLERHEEARTEALAAMSATPRNVNLPLACANVYAMAPRGEEDFIEDYDALRLQWINSVMAETGLEPLTLAQPEKGLCFDNLKVVVPTGEMRTDGPLVSVIMPVFNASSRIETSVRSLLAQTWKNIEIIVVDDVSTDDTVQVVSRLSQEDSRVRLVQAKENAGPYVARNLGLQEARGEFVTTHDDDDWSHPRKIESQVEHLLANRSVVANLSAHVRADDEVRFSLRGNPGFYLFPNMSSLMFRRKPVLEKVGYWDSVRFGGDSEFKKRLERVFGEHAVRSLPTGPVCMLRVRGESLTANRTVGYHGYKVGARREYDEVSAMWHDRTDQGKPVFMPFPLKDRPFPIPHIMRHARGEEEQQFDIILVSDFRLDGGTSASNAQEIKAARDLGLKVGLVQSGAYLLRPNRKMNNRIRKLVDGDRVQVLTWGEKAHADLVLIRFPLLLNDRNYCVPDVRADHVRIIANQPPQRTWDSDSELLYEIAACDAEAKRRFGRDPVWHPIGPTAREGLKAINAPIELSDWDWVNIIDINDWKSERESRPSGRIVIGRHSRDHWVKWPENADDLRAAYPDDKDFEIRVLGGANVPAETLGRLPRNWVVHPFGAMDPKTFLKDIDIFVYFTHSQYLEAFGRTIFEAMAVGVPVILPEQFRKVFKETALYAAPMEVRAITRQLMTDREFYAERVALGRRYVEEHFGYEQHLQRLRPLVSRLREASSTHSAKSTV